MTSGTCIQTLDGHSYGVNSVTVSSDSKYIISGSDDKSIKVWDMTSGACIQTLNSHSDAVSR